MSSDLTFDEALAKLAPEALTEARRELVLYGECVLEFDREGGVRLLSRGSYVLGRDMLKRHPWHGEGGL